MQEWQGLTSPQGKICLKSLAWDCKVDQYICRLTAKQRYVNTSDVNVEAVYTFSVPHDAVVTGFTLIAADGTRRTAVPKRRHEAEAAYEDAVASGDQPAILSMTEAGICTVSIGSLLPKEEVTLEISSVFALAVAGGRARITIPTVTAKRYSRDGSQGKLLPHERIEEDFRVEYPFTAHAEFTGEMFRRCSFSVPGFTPEIIVAETGVTADVRAGLCERDLVFTVSGLDAKPEALLLKDGDGVRPLVFMPLPASEAVPESGLRLKVVLDCSGSMQGASIREAKRALKVLGNTLTPEDAITFTKFGWEVETLVPVFTPVTPAFLRRDFIPEVRKCEADMDGTEIGGALEHAFTLDGGKPSDVLLITDGQVWALERLVAAVRASGHRIFVIGVGNAVVHSGCRLLADVSGGAFEAVLPTEDMEAAVVRMVRRMREKAVAIESIEPAVLQLGSTSASYAGEVVALVGNKTDRIEGTPCMTGTGSGGRFAVETQLWRSLDDKDALKLAAFLWMQTVLTRNHQKRYQGVCRDMEEEELQFDPSVDFDVEDTGIAVNTALDYGILSNEVSFFLMNERDADKKAFESQLQQIPQPVPNFLCCSYASRSSIDEDACLSTIEHFRIPKYLCKGGNIEEDEEVKPAPKPRPQKTKKDAEECWRTAEERFGPKFTEAVKKFAELSGLSEVESMLVAFACPNCLPGWWDVAMPIYESLSENLRKSATLIFVNVRGPLVRRLRSEGLKQRLRSYIEDDED